MTPRWTRALAAALLLLPAAAASSRAQEGPAAEAGAIVTVVTFGIGSQVWERFGHNALWIRDARTGTDLAYNWGLFDFAQPGFLGRFLTGDTRYWMEGQDPVQMLEAYRRIGRPITLQRLALSAPQAEALRQRLAVNAREENKFYRYDYFRDNCSTRLRDALDAVLGGALRRASDTVRTTHSYRSESVRLTDGDGAVQLGIDLALGRPADARLTAWESYFVPMRLRDGLRRVTVPNGAGGALVPLVREERHVEPEGGARVTERTDAPRLVLRYLLGGLLFAALAVALRVMMVTRRSAAWGLALFSAGWWLVTGIVGILIVLAWTATRHVFWAQNENVLLLTPLGILLAVLAPMSILSRRAMRGARVAALAAAACGLVAAFLALAPGGQDNRAIVALILPVHLALAGALALPRVERSAVRP